MQNNEKKFTSYINAEKPLGIFYLKPYQLICLNKEKI